MEKWIKDALNIEQNIQILYNPCPNIKKYITQKENTILFAGTIIERKGYADLIKGFAKISHKHKDWKIIMAGNGEIEKAQSIAKNTA